MKIKELLATAIVAVLLLTAGCSQNNARKTDAVKQALQQADLTDVTVSDDTNKNTITLGGTVHSEDAKSRAEDVAKQAAPDSTIANEISVQPAGAESQGKSEQSNLDDGIESNYKAALTSKRLDKQSIHYDAENGVLKLTGNVKTQQQKKEAELLASKWPNVKQVVNEIEVRR